MRAHVIENGIVVNTIEIEHLDFMPEISASLIDAALGGKIGDLWDSQTFTAPPSPEVIVPPTLTKADLLDQLAALSAQIQALE